MEDRILDKIISIVRNNLNEEGAMATPTMSVGSGENVSLPPAIEPPVRRKNKKKYIYQKNSRKLWKI